MTEDLAPEVDLIPDVDQEKALREARANAIRMREASKEDWYIFARKVRPEWDEMELARSYEKWVVCEQRLDDTKRDSRGKESRVVIEDFKGSDPLPDIDVACGLVERDV